MTTNTLKELRQFNSDSTTDLTELLALSLSAKALRTEFQNRSLSTPEWLDDVNRRIDRAIETQTADQKALRLKQLIAERSGLMSATEKRAALDVEIAALTS